MTESTRQMVHYRPNLTVKDAKHQKRTPSGVFHKGGGKLVLKEECHLQEDIMCLKLGKSMMKTHVMLGLRMAYE